MLPISSRRIVDDRTTPKHNDCVLRNNQQRLEIDVAGYTVQGKRFENEDCISCFKADELTVAVVSDGIGGAPHGAVISKIAVGSFMDEIREGASARAAFEAVNIAATKIVKWLDSPGSGATFACVYIEGSCATIVWAGDSIVYLWRNGVLECVARPMRSKDGILLGCVGSSLDTYPSLRRIELRPGDKILLCTDGVWDSVDEVSIEETLSQSGRASDMARQLANAGAANGSDNSTAAVFCINRSHRRD